MKSGALPSVSIAPVTRIQSPSSSWPCFRRLWSTLPTEHSRRWAISALDISSENSATGFCNVTATCSAMLSARLVLPIEGRAARITRFDFCRPEVWRSSSPKPVGRPVTPLPSPFSNSSVSRWKASSSGCLMSVKSSVVPFCAIS